MGVMGRVCYSVEDRNKACSGVLLFCSRAAAAVSLSSPVCFIASLWLWSLQVSDCSMAQVFAMQYATSFEKYFLLLLGSLFF